MIPAGRYWKRDKNSLDVFIENQANKTSQKEKNYIFMKKEYLRS